MNNKKKKDNFNPYPGLGGIPNDTTIDGWGITSDTSPSDTPLNNWFGASPIPTSNVFSRVNVEQVLSLFSPTMRFQMPSSVRLLTMTGSEVFISNDVFELTNISLILSIKGQLEDGIFKRENNSVLDLAYLPQNGLTSDNYYVGYTALNNDMHVVSTMTQAATRLITIFNDLGINLTSDLITNKLGGIRLRDIFMSAYVICLQIIIMYNAKRDHMKAEKLRNIQPPVKDDIIGNNVIDPHHLDKIFGMPTTETNLDTEHKSIFDGVKPDENGMFNIEFGKDSDELTEIIDKAREYELNNTKEVKKDE